MLQFLLMMSATIIGILLYKVIEGLYWRIMLKKTLSKLEKINKTLLEKINKTLNEELNQELIKMKNKHDLYSSCKEETPADKNVFSNFKKH